MSVATIMRVLRSEMAGQPKSLDELTAACDGRRGTVIKKLAMMKANGEARRVDNGAASGPHARPVWAILP